MSSRPVTSLTIDAANPVLDTLRGVYKSTPACIFHLGEAIERQRQRAVLQRNSYVASICELLLTTMANLQTLTYHDARHLLGILSYIRDNPRRLTMEQLFAHYSSNQSHPLQNVLLSLGDLYINRMRAIGIGHFPDEGPTYLLKEDSDLLELHHKIAGIREEFDRLFANEALTLVRLAYLHGVNVVNPDWGHEHGPSSLDCNGAFYITVAEKLPTNNDGEAIHIRPKRPDCTLVSYNGPADGHIRNTFPLTLHNGEAIIVGRNLTINSIFGISSSEGLTGIPVDGRIDHGLWSRACLIIARHNDEIFLLDRGTRNSFVVWSKARTPGSCFIYHPEPQVHSTGRVLYGLLSCEVCSF
jgi:hypothetical protein